MDQQWYESILYELTDNYIRSVNFVLDDDENIISTVIKEDSQGQSLETCDIHKYYKVVELSVGLTARILQDLDGFNVKTPIGELRINFTSDEEDNWNSCMLHFENKKVFAEFTAVLRQQKVKRFFDNNNIPSETTK